MARAGPNLYAEAHGKPYARQMNVTGKPLKGFVYVSPKGFESDEELM